MKKRLIPVLIMLFILTAVVLPAMAYETVDVNNGAILKGTVVYKGTRPADETIRIDRDNDICGDTQTAGKYLINHGRVKNVVIWLEGVKAGKKLPQKDVEITISGCRITPLVSVGFVGGRYRIRNNDPILHTVQLKLGLSYHKNVSARPLANGATIYNIAMPEKGMEVVKPIKLFHRYRDKTGFIRVTSNTHPWMRGFIFVFDHPYAAVTDTMGSFVITDIPPGEYLLKLWHEGFGIREMKIKLGPSDTRQLEIDLSGKSNVISSEEATPSIRFLEKRYRFGTLTAGKAVSHDFRFVNEGSGVLKIKALIPA
ncbi:MAG: hypothetical protein GXO97_03720 [Nitrospirae bacterium]|nr:hypothetical protein [Nitrospirota bacterium]